jgi:hypothetical protein
MERLYKILLLCHQLEVDILTNFIRLIFKTKTQLHPNYILYKIKNYWFLKNLKKIKGMASWPPPQA